MGTTVETPVVNSNGKLSSKPFSSYFQKKPYVQTLPEYGYVYLDHLQAEYEGMLIDRLSDKSKAIIKNINERKKENTITWSDVYAYESIFMRVVHNDDLPRKTWDLRNRYRDTVGLKEYEAYLASKPPEISTPAVADELRSDINFLLNKIYLHYSLTPFNESLRNSISKKVTYVVLVGLFLIIVTVVSHSMPGVYIPSALKIESAPILIVIYAGAMGGLMSMLQRFNSLVREGDPIDSLPDLMQYWSRIFIPAINGALFAALLYIIFIAKLVEGSLFPAINDLISSGERASIGSLLTEAAPSKSIDYAKLIVWSFIAGFAERFVPSALSSIVSKKDKTVESKAA